jgi:hypothetical protein
MTRRSLVVAGVVTLLLVGAGTAFVPGMGSGSDTGVNPESTATETTGGETTSNAMASGGAADGDGETSSGDTTHEEGTTDTPPFVISTDSIEECGWTCRDVTSALTNHQATTAENVTVTTDLYAGNETDGDTLWEGSEAIGTIGEGESYTTTTRINLGYIDAFAVKQADGWISIETTVRTADQTVTFSEQRQVA